MREEEVGRVADMAQECRPSAKDGDSCVKVCGYVQGSFKDSLTYIYFCVDAQLSDRWIMVRPEEEYCLRARRCVATGIHYIYAYVYT